jgi:hypothetical protein
MMEHLAAMCTVREGGVDTYGPTPLSDSLTDAHVQDTVRFWYVLLAASPDGGTGACLS